MAARKDVKFSKSLSIVESSISDLALALQNGTITAVDLVAKCLLRISTYDCRNTALNSIPLLNPNVFEEAAASDQRRRNGQSRGLLDGIPFTVKDSYKVAGMTVASGSEAFKDLIANEDAFTVEALRKAGAILIGKTNMCPMAFGGMQRGVYGRAESPYNSKYLAAAFASGSSNGSGVSTAASFAAFGMGEETVSSGRSPASNNGLVAYTPSRGLISIRGNWPLYPTCDTVVPHTRSVEDLFAILDVLATEDTRTEGDFWRDQPFVDISKCWHDRPATFQSLRDPRFLRGKKIGVPQMYIDPENEHGVYVSESVRSLWEKARSDLEASGATVTVMSDFPAVMVYEDPTKWPEGDSSTRLPEDWNSSERGTLIAHSWDDFLRRNGDPHIPALAAADHTKMFPQPPPDHPQVAFSEVANAVHWSKLASYVEDNTRTSVDRRRKIYEIPDLEQAVKALEHMRKSLLEDWMAGTEVDLVVFPAAGDVGHADADINMDSAKHAWRNGVKYSNGNRALRHLGIPSVTVPMGMLADKDMPVGLTIIGKAYEDVEILKAGYAFEQLHRRRLPPRLTPAIRSDLLQTSKSLADAPPTLRVEKCAVFSNGGIDVVVEIEGTFALPSIHMGDSQPTIEIFVDAKAISNADTHLQAIYSADGNTTYSFNCSVPTPVPKTPDSRNKVVGRIARDSIIVIVLARSQLGASPAGCLRLVHMDDVIRN